jgi:urea transport system permease protein
MLGALFVLVTLLLPKGIVGTWNAWRDARRATSLSEDTDSAAFEDGAVKPHMAE